MFVPAVDFEGEAQLGYSAGIEQGPSGELFEPAHPVPDRVGMTEQDAGRLAGGAAIVEPGPEGSEQDRPLAGRDLTRRPTSTSGHTWPTRTTWWPASSTAPSRNAVSARRVAGSTRLCSQAAPPTPFLEPDTKYPLSATVRERNGYLISD
jgi:hypothetical protein